MDFLLSSPAVNQAPVVDPSGNINLRDWKMAGSLQATTYNKLQLPSHITIEVTDQPEAPNKQILELSDEDLVWASTHGEFPAINAAMFLRGLTSEVSAIAPMLSFGEFFKEFSSVLKGLVESEIAGENKSEWIGYYASSLANYPIFNTILNILEPSIRDEIAAEYLSQYADTKYLSPEQIANLTVDEKVRILKAAFSTYAGNDGKMNVAISLFGADEVIPVVDAAYILGNTRSSVVAGRLMNCAGFYNDYTNSYNVVATWVRHCINEKIGTNQSVWYKAATELEIKHNFSMAGDYIKNLQGTPIGLNQTSQLGGVSGGFKSIYSRNQPIGL